MAWNYEHLTHFSALLQHDSWHGTINIRPTFSALLQHGLPISVFVVWSYKRLTYFQCLGEPVWPSGKALGW